RAPGGSAPRPPGACRTGEPEGRRGVSARGPGRSWSSRRGALPVRIAARRLASLALPPCPRCAVRRRRNGGGMALWLIPTLTSLLLYGIGQGLVKKSISEVPPARFCLYF